MSSRSSSPLTPRRRNAQPRGQDRGGLRRPRSPSRSSSLEPPDKRPRIDPDWSAAKRNLCPYGVAAREITRIVDMFWEPRDVIIEAVHLLSLDSQDDIDAEMASATGKKRKLYDIFATLSERLPDLIKFLEGGQKAWDEVRQRFERGKSAARTEDNHTFKQWAPEWLDWNPPLDPLKKTNRGLTHEECAELLCPVTVDWEDEEARQKFRVEQDPPMTADVWPALLWEGNHADPDHLGVGLFRNELLFKAGRAVLFPPSIANANDPHSNKSNRQPKASMYKMTGVTSGFLAYTAVLLRYTLSTEESFQESSGTFNYRIFYNDLVTYLETPEFAAESGDLMKWWNDRMFPPKETQAALNGSSSMLARLRQQRERDARLEGEPGRGSE